MIESLQTQNFRMLPSNLVALGPFHVLVGQNATGKSTFLGAIQLIADILAKGVTRAVRDITPNFYDLCFDPTEPVALAVELNVPPAPEAAAPANASSRIRYELEFGIDPGNGGGLRVLREHLFLRPTIEAEPEVQGNIFGLPPAIHIKTPRTWRKVVSKTAEGKDYFQDEKTSWNHVLKFGPDRAALGNLPDDPERFPQSIAARDLLRDGVQTLALDPAKLRAASPPGGTPRIALDGSNLPLVVQELMARDPTLFAQWVRHVATGVRGLKAVAVRERPEDKHLVLEATFEGRHDQPVPSWLLSDGTLRLMMLTLLTYAATPSSREVFLVEEPENGLHPLAIQTVYDALSSPVGDVQILCATHSPILLAHVALEHALVFRRSPEGSAIVRSGPEVPELKSWGGRRNLSDLFASGVLS